MAKRIAVLLVIVVFLLWKVPYGMGYFVNVTPSYPFGLYKLQRGFDWRRDKFELVLFCPFGVLLLPPYQSYLPEAPVTHCNDGAGFAPLFKRVVAVPGDVVESNDEVITVNGLPLPFTQRRHKDTSDHPLPKAPDRVVLSDNVWLMSTYSTVSWDSRYYGPVPLTAIIGVVKPVWTW